MLVEGDRPLRSDAAKNRERLLRAAGQVFEAQGLEASVADVARAAGVGMGTLYRRFPSKDALIDALVTGVLEATVAMAEEAAEQPDGLGLEKFLAASASYEAEHVGCLPKVWCNDHELIHVARRLIARLLADAKVHHRVREDLTTTDITLAKWSIRGVLETAGGTNPQIWQRHLDLLIAGMRPAGDKLPHRPVSQAQVDRIRYSSQADPCVS
ncbi:MAG TPA: helix-turn-helix domain-containing protein [Acidimicrobiales bacterium]